MLTKDEKNYLTKIPSSKKVYIKTFFPKTKTVGNNIVSQIKERLPKLNVLFIGAAALEIAGQNDIDIYILSNPKDFDKYLPTLTKLFGEPKRINKTFIEWRFMKKDHQIELYLTAPPKRQIRIYEILKSNKKLLKKYEDLKLKFNGKSFRDYQKAKYEFFNKILK